MKGEADMTVEKVRVSLVWVVALAAVLVLVFAAVGCSAGSQGSPAVGDVTQSQTLQAVDTVTVSGYGEVPAAPDKAVVTVSVQTNAADAAQAMDQNSQTMTAVIDRLKSEGIQDSMIETSNVSVMPNTTYDPQTGEQKTQGYLAQNTITVTLRDLSLVGKVMAASTQAGANMVSGPVWSLSDNTEATKQALEKAVAAARSKAEALATATGVKVGDVLAINESSTSTPPIVYESAKAAGDSSMVSPPVNPQDVLISSNVTITYRLVR
jgi:uncharacterized protein